MGGKRTRKGKHFLFYFTCIIIVSFLFGEGCIPQKRYQDKQQEQIQQSLMQAKNLMKKGNYKVALKKYQEIAKLFPQIEDKALYEIGLIYAHPKNPDKNFEESLKYFQKLVREFPKSNLRNQAEVWILILQGIKEKEKAIKALKEKISVLQKENKIKSKKINDLEKQIEKLKEIDLTIEEKKRESLP